MNKELISLSQMQMYVRVNFRGTFIFRLFLGQMKHRTNIRVDHLNNRSVKFHYIAVLIANLFHKYR